MRTIPLVLTVLHLHQNSLRGISQDASLAWRCSLTYQPCLAQRSLEDDHLERVMNSVLRPDDEAKTMSSASPANVFQPSLPRSRP